MKINEKRLTDTFLELVKIDSESFNEKNIQEVLASKLKALGCTVYVDNAGKKYNTNAKGNVIGFLPGTVKSKPIVLSSHMDTVTPGKSVKPVVKKDRITSDGTTILVRPSGTEHKIKVYVLTIGENPAARDENLRKYGEWVKTLQR